MNYKKLWSLVSIALMLTVFIGCGRMELLQNDNIESYKFLDHQALAPGMSLQEALDTIMNPPVDNPAKLSEAISTITAVMGLTTSSINDPYKTYSINDMALAMETALAGSGFSLPQSVLQNVMISTINIIINQTIINGSLDRTKPENAVLYTLAEGVMQRTGGKTELTVADADNPNLMDTAGFLILTTAMNQATNSTVDDAITEGSKAAINDTVNKINSATGLSISGNSLANQLIPKPNPLLGGLLTNVVKQQLAKEPEVIQKENALINETKTEMSTVMDEKITNQVMTELASELRQMQAEGKLQGVIIPDQIDLNSLKDVMTQVSANDLQVIQQQASTIQDKVVEEVKTDIATEINNIEQTNQTELEDFVETTAQETGTTVNVEPIVPEHNQGIIIIE